MKKYKGYYIDHIIFNSKEDIDKHIKSQYIRRIKILNDLLFNMPAGHYNFADKMAIVEDMNCIETRLHDDFNMDWEEIELIPYK